MTINIFQLIRLVLIDSFSPDRIVELPLDGGAVLTGRNGRGKTSLLQLLMLFYGESPSRIVSSEAGRDSFIAYYLPRSTSYIVFEYMRADGGKRMVVVYADKHGELLRYRFVRQGFDVVQFVTGDNQIVPAGELLRHLKLHGFEPAECQVETTTDYRNIIQGIPSSSTDRRHQQNMRQLMLDYAFTSSKQSLRQVEKIVSGMFRRKTNFDDLQSMVIDCVSDEAVEHSITGDRRKIEDWPKGYRAYMSVMAHETKMDQVSQADEQLQTIEGELAQLWVKYVSLQQHLEQQREQSNQQTQALERMSEEENADFLEQKSQLTSQRVTAQQTAQLAEQKAASLHAQSEQYAAQNMPEQEARLNNLPRLQQEQGHLRQRREILLGEQHKISLRYDQLKHDEQTLFNRDLEQLLVQQQQVQADYGQRGQRLQQQFEQQQQLQREQNEQQREVLEQVKHEASEEQGRCKSLLQNPLLQPEVLALVEQKQITLDNIRQEMEGQNNPYRELEQAYLAAKHAFDEQERVLSLSVRELQRAEQSLHEKRALLAPDEGTLLHFLKHSHPEWGSDIAKVIDPALLQRRDLQPGLLEHTASMYGLTLNLERMEAHSSAHTSSAEQAVVEAEQVVAQLQIAQSSARKLLEERAKQREQAQQRRQQQLSLIQSLELKLATARDEIEEAKKQLEEHKRQAQQQARQQLEQAQTALQAADSQLKQFDQQTRSEQQRGQQLYQQQRNELQQQCQSESERLDATIAKRKQRLTEAAQQLDLERDQALQQQGVDTVQLKQLDLQLESVGRELAEIDGFSEAVKKWRYWLETEWPAYHEYMRQAELERANEAGFVTQLDSLSKHWKTRLQTLQQQRQQQQQYQAQLDTQLKRVRDQLDNLATSNALPALTYDPAWTLDSLTAQNNQLQQTARKQHEVILQLLGDMAKGFRLNSGTPPEQYLQAVIYALSPNPCREWIAPFKHWFDSQHQEFKRLLLSEAGSIAGSVQTFYDTMTKFHQRVLQFNRELQAHLDTGSLFESISHLSIEVVSTLHELKYWPAIREMAEAYRDWNSGLSNELPPLEFAQNIEQLMEHWEVKAGIRADLINLIRLQGEVTENGNRRIFKRASDLEVVSSNGLSYLILATIFVAFINRIRCDAPVNIVWALDELKDLDAGNVVGLMKLLERNNITLVSAFPDPDPDTLALFKHRFTIEPDRRLARVTLMEVDSNWMTEK